MQTGLSPESQEKLVEFSRRVARGEVAAQALAIERETAFLLKAQEYADLMQEYRRLSDCYGKTAQAYSGLIEEFEVLSDRYACVVRAIYQSNLSDLDKWRLRQGEPIATAKELANGDGLPAAEVIGSDVSSHIAGLLGEVA